jgi:hypothetical protein
MEKKEMIKTPEETCDTCAHKNDSGTEYCGCCDDITNSYKEAGWHIRERLNKQIADLTAIVERQRAEIERLNELVFAYDSIKAPKIPLSEKIDVDALIQQLAAKQTLIEQLAGALRDCMLFATDHTEEHKQKWDATLDAVEKAKESNG